MSNGSPTAYLLWAILSCIFLVFLFLHLWNYDRFQCLKWDSGRQPGAFKRVMTYAYVYSVPSLVVFSVGMTAIKYKEGFVALSHTAISEQYIIPRPFFLWNRSNKRWLLPLYFVLSSGWGLELVTHLEELTFWLFLLHQGPKKREWFRSWEFRVWCLGSIIAVIGMPLTTFVTRTNLPTCQAWIFLVGSSAGTSTTLIFLYVLARFPGFIRHVKAEGAEPVVVVRLETFYQLNLVRVVFRFVFSLPLFILALDAIRTTHTVVTSPFWFDFLLMMASVGCFVSSAITLLIFFPRPTPGESNYHAANSPSKLADAATSPLPNYNDHHENTSSPKSLPVFANSHQHSITGLRLATFRYPTSPPHSPQPHDLYPQRDSLSQSSVESEGISEYESDAESITAPKRPVPNPRSPLPEATMSERRVREPVASPGTYAESRGAYSREKTVVLSPGSQEIGAPVSSSLHPYVMTFTSPIDLLDLPDEDDVI